MGKRVDWGAIGQWVGVAIGLAAFLASLAGEDALPGWYGYVWPLFALVGLVCAGAIILHLLRGEEPSEPELGPVPTARAEGERSIAITGSVTHSIVSTDRVSLHAERVELHPTAKRADLPEPPPFDPQVVPPPGDLPPGSYLPFVRNKCFTGRMGDLRALAQRLIGQDRAAAGGQLRLALAGMGGLGKTTLAAEFAHRYGQYFPGGVFWLNAVSAEALEGDLVQCGLGLGLRPWPKEQPEQVAAVLRAWGEPVGRLVVLDNAVEVKLLREWLGRVQGSQLRLLITARRPGWPPELGVPAYGLELFPPEESRALLRRLAARLEAEPEEGLEAIAGRLGHLPLALDLAGRYLQDREGLTAAGYLAELEEAENALEHASLKDWVEAAEVPHPASVAAAFEMSYRRLETDEERDELTRRLFAAAGYLVPGMPIPRELFRELAGDEAGADRAVGRLMDLGLLSRAAEGVTIHPLLAEYSRLESDGAALAEVAGTLVALSAEVVEAGYPSRLPGLWPHVEVVARRVGDLSLEVAAALWNNLAYHLDEVAEYRRAREHYERALAICERALGPEHPGAATCHNNLGAVLRQVGDYVGARQHCEQALAIYEQALGPEHPTVARCHNNLGVLLQDKGDYGGAREHHERALAIRLKALDPQHPDVAMCHSNLGIVLQHERHYAGARQRHEQALAILERSLGPEHPEVAACHNNLGNLFQDVGDYGGAREHYERALAIFEQSLGPEHPNVAGCHNNLGNVLQHVGGYAGARHHHEQALAIRLKALGPEHAEVAMSHSNLGVVLGELGEYAGAREQFGQALAIRLKALGPEHPDVATCHNNLGVLLRHEGDYPAAREHHGQALAIRLKALGPEHPEVAMSHSNLGNVLADLGDYAGAREHYEQALGIYEKTLPPDHPEIRRVRGNLGSLPGQEG